MGGLGQAFVLVYLGVLAITVVGEGNFPPGCEVHQYGRKLHCRRIGLKSLPRIKDLGNITIADFSDNNITHISYKEIEHFRKLKELYIDKNPFHCSCELYWLRSYLLDNTRHIVKRRENIRCATPTGLKNKPLKALTHVELCGQSKHFNKRAIIDCSTGIVPCQEHALCKEQQCVCKRGFEESGEICADINECNDKSSLCDISTTVCINTVGSYECQCRDGFRQATSRRCVDVNECEKDPCHKNAVCENTDGSFECTCQKGYHGNGKECADIEECKSGTHNCENALSKCKNTGGGFYCKCKDGYEKNSDKCMDIDECTRKKCGLMASCVNTIGSFKCSCKPGFFYSDLHCFDVDECKLKSHTCNQTSMACQNTIGSFKCECKTNFFRLHTDCVDIDECTAKEEEYRIHCEGDMKCRNIPGSFSCECDRGFKPDIQRRCRDIDECKRRTHNCSAHSHCKNTAGSYKCFCHKGFNGDGVKCSPSELTRWTTLRYLSQDLENGAWDRILALVAVCIVLLTAIAGIAVSVRKIYGKFKSCTEARRKREEEEKEMLKMNGRFEQDMYLGNPMCGADQMLYTEDGQMFFPGDDQMFYSGDDQMFYPGDDQMFYPGDDQMFYSDPNAVFFQDEMYDFYPQDITLPPEQMCLKTEESELDMVFAAVPGESYDPSEGKNLIHQENEDDDDDQ